VFLGVLCWRRIDALPSSRDANHQARIRLAAVAAASSRHAKSLSRQQCHRETLLPVLVAPSSKAVMVNAAPRSWSLLVGLDKELALG
jgi:hypothetical protein